VIFNDDRITNLLPTLNSGLLRTGLQIWKSLAGAGAYCILDTFIDFGTTLVYCVLLVFSKITSFSLAYFFFFLFTSFLSLSLIIYLLCF